jgi:invasion protein IalB
MDRSTTLAGVRATGAAIVVAAASFVLMTVAADAQQPPPKATQPKAAPKQQPAPPAPPQVQGPAADQQLQLVHSPWTKFCGKEGGREVCLTMTEARLDTGSFVAGAALIEQQGEQKKVLRVTLPLGMQLPHGTRMIVDQGQPNMGQFLVCLPNGCMAEFEVNPSIVGQLKGGKTLWLQAINLSGQAANYGLPLTEFAKANDGPPTDPKAFEERQRKLEEEMQRKAEEARQRLEREQGAPRR